MTDLHPSQSWHQGGRHLCVEAWGPGALRFRATAGPAIRDDLPGCLLPALPCDAVLGEQPGRQELTTGDLRCVLETPTGRLHFYEAAGRLLWRKYPAMPNTPSFGRLPISKDEEDP